MIAREDSQAGDNATLSVVIPVLDDLRALSDLIDRLRLSANAPEQIVVVDGNAADDCHQICRDADCDYLPLEPNRGRQLDAGAQLAHGDILWFLHADALPPADGPDQVRRHVAAGNAGGYFRFAFAGESRWYKQLLAALINVRARVGIPYGDQGLFATREAYSQSAGFAPTPLFEEVALVRSLRRLGRFAPLAAPIGVSPRRWERDGWLRRTINNRLLALAFLAGVSPARLARNYHAGGAA